jgi:hypothetical protein
MQPPAEHMTGGLIAAALGAVAAPFSRPKVAGAPSTGHSANNYRAIAAINCSDIRRTFAAITQLAKAQRRREVSKQRRVLTDRSVSAIWRRAAQTIPPHQAATERDRTAFRYPGYSFTLTGA